MTEIHVINNQNRECYNAVMRSYHRLRHDIFVGERKWMDLYSPDGLETDGYDNDNSIYLLALEGDRVIGGQRLYPTLLPHMISETFPHLVQGPPPASKRILEWTRYFIIKERRRTQVDGRLLAAVQQYCLEEGITHLTAVGETWWLPRWHQYGFSVHPLGLPQMIEGKPTLAVHVAISEQSYETVLQVAGLKHVDLVRHTMDPFRKEQVANAA